MKKAVIILPTYNESKNISPLLSDIFTISKKVKNWQIGVLVVDSDSPDKTAEIVKKLQKEYGNLDLLITKKEGLGMAYIKGFSHAISKTKPDLLFEMDADISHDPKKILEFIKKIDEGADFVIGSRYIKGGSIPQDWGIHRKIFSVLGNIIIKLGFMKPKISDWTSGYRAIKTWVVEASLPFIKQYSGYVFQVALIDNALKNNARFEEVPINFIDRKYGISKINSLQYITQTFSYVFTNSSFIKYVIVGATGAMLDFGISYILISKVGFPQKLFWLATLISAEAAIVSNFLFNNFWSFSHKKLTGKKNYFLKFLHFNLISGGALLIQAIGIQLSTLFFPAKYWYLYKLAIILVIIIPYSYILYNKLIWKEKN